MSETEKQESQKTVVAFISGLLIGGLLVWIFSSSPENTQKPSTESETEKSESGESSENKSDTSVSASDVKKQEVTKEIQKVEVGEGSLSVSNQKAGTMVQLGPVTFPAEAGWIVVRDDVNGAPGNTLGAARYNTKDGLIPTAVELLRATEAGKKYQVMFYTQEGNLTFALTEDKPTTVPSATFSAE